MRYISDPKRNFRGATNSIFWPLLEIKCTGASWVFCLQAVMESVAPSAAEDNNLFVIDTVGETLTESKVTEVPEVPVKKLKRRNAAMYSSSD